jgi:type IV pilus assembly protein PilV
MIMIKKASSLHCQSGAGLIEVLIAVLILSFGLLSLAGLLAYSLHISKSASLRATAMQLGLGYAERIRANPTGFSGGIYDETNSSYDGSSDVPALSDCAFPNCTVTTLGTMDKAYMGRILRQQLPAGGLTLTRSGNQANLWIMWKESEAQSALAALSNDNCPSFVKTTYATNMPRCLYIAIQL